MGVDWDSWGDYQANPADHESFGPVGYHDNPYTTGEASADAFGNSADSSADSSPSSPAGARASSPKKSAQSGNTKEAIKLVIWGIIIILALINVVITFAR